MNHSPSRTVRIPCVSADTKERLWVDWGGQIYGCGGLVIFDLFIYLFLVTKTTYFLLYLVHKYSIYYNHSSCAKIKAVLQSVKKRNLHINNIYREMSSPV